MLRKFIEEWAIKNFLALFHQNDPASLAVTFKKKTHSHLGELWDFFFSEVMKKIVSDPPATESL